jgi:hypothetical protein
MGVQIPGVLAGYTNGTITTVDYTLEMGAIVTALNICAAQLTLLNTNFFATFSPAATFVPNTMAQHAAISKNMLIQMAGSGDSDNDKQDKKTLYLHGIKSAIDALAKAQHDMMAIQTLAVSDQIANNSFQKQATIDALKRNDLPEPQPPNLVDTIKEKVVAAEQIHVTGMLSGTIASITSNVVDKVEDYILTSGPVVYAQTVIEDGFTAVSSAVTNTIKDFLPSSLFKLQKKKERVMAKVTVDPLPPTE